MEDIYSASQDLTAPSAATDCGSTKSRPSIRDVFDSDLKPAARLVYAAMCFYGAKTRRCWLAIPLLAKHCGLSKSGAREAVRQLEKAGYIQRVFSSRGGTRKGKNGKITGIPSEYVLRAKTTVATPHSVAGSEVVPTTECASTHHSMENYPPISGGKGQAQHDDAMTTAARECTTVQQPSAHPDAVADHDERLEAAKPYLDVMEARLGPITQKTRASIQQTVEAQGYTVAQLAYAFRLYGRAYKTVGGLISFARELAQHAKCIDRWPSAGDGPHAPPPPSAKCDLCGDTGEVLLHPQREYLPDGVDRSEVIGPCPRGCQIAPSYEAA